MTWRIGENVTHPHRLMPGSLTFGAATSDRLNIAGDAAFNGLSAFAIGQWVKFSALTADRTFFGTGGTEWIAIIRAVNDGVRFQVARATTGADVFTTVPLFNTTGRWFVVCWFDSGAAAGTQARIYVGTDTSDAAEASYAGQSDGSGAVTSLAGAGITLFNSSANNQSLQCDGAHVVIWTTAPTLAQMIAAQFNANDRLLGEAYIRASHNGDLDDLTGHGHNATLTGATTAATIFPELGNQQSVGHPMLLGAGAALWT